MLSISDYKALSRNVGRWEGTVKVLNEELQEIRHYQIAQQFEAVDNKWIITNTYTFRDGTSMSHSFDVIPTIEHQVQVKTTDDRFQTTTMQAMEYGEDIVNFKITNTTTGSLQELETITLIGERERLRTAQLFDQDGAFKGLLVIA
ncbi:MAG: DUF3598 family protein, partial [Chroococcidiopsidaceae cyanobacterium CP_BM_RX_35]|nr:DUF3598 family protein [Chroococcidiopsidaceae cyanobacterium CP_BM_RX_35]